MRGDVYAIIFIALHGPALACVEATNSRDYYATPIETKPDGSFKSPDIRSVKHYGGDQWIAGWRQGAKVVDIGGGRVGQKITRSFGCGYGEKLVFIDCTIGDAISVAGVSTFETDLLAESSVALLQPPHGPIALTPTISVDEVEAKAIAHKFDFTRDIAADANEMARFQRYDPFIGCKIFYPDSPGAQM